MKFSPALLLLPTMTMAGSTGIDVPDYCDTFVLELDALEYEWRDPVGGTFVDIDENEIMWGQSPAGSMRSGLKITADHITFPKMLYPGTQEDFGELKHFNFQIFRFGSISQVDLAIKIFTNVGDFEFVFELRVNETPNARPCEFDSPTDPCADEIYFATQPGSQSVTVPITEQVFEIQLLGFRTDPNGETIDQFISQEEQMSTARLYGQLHLTDCPETPEVDGDPHFHTWIGNWYDFHGACDLHLMNAPNFAPSIPMVIDVRTRTRSWYSYVESAAIKIGDDILEVSSFGDYFLNGVEAAKMPNKLAGYPVTYSEPRRHVRLVEIALEGTDEKITIRTFKDMVSIKIVNGSMDRFYGSSGMMGDSMTGHVHSRDHKTVLVDPAAIAREWQVRDDEPVLFQTVQGPQYPQPCEMPKKQMPRPGIGKTIALEAAKNACAHWSAARIQGCIDDVMKTGDFELAAVGEF